MENTFTLTITGTEHAEWQGVLQKANGSGTEFKSVLELLKMINRQLEEAKGQSGY